MLKYLVLFFILLLIGMAAAQPFHWLKITPFSPLELTISSTGRFIAIDKQKNDIAYSDDGANWVPLPSPEFFPRYTCALDRLYSSPKSAIFAVCYSGEMFISFDNGILWEAFLGSSGYRVLTIGIDAIISYSMTPVQCFIYFSSDDGKTWNSIKVNNYHRASYAYYVNSKGVLFINAHDQLGGDGLGTLGLLRSYDNGETWEKIGPYTDFYIDLQDRLFKSDNYLRSDSVSFDDGNTWQYSSFPWQSVILTIFDGYFLRHDGQYFLRQDYDQADVSVAMPPGALKKLVLSPYDHQVYALTDSGIYRAQKGTTAVTQSAATRPEKPRIINYPNPFNQSTRIEYYIEKPGKARLEIYDISGRIIQARTLIHTSPGIQHYDFNSTSLASGVYYYSVLTDKNCMKNKMIFLR